jgi:hypothetical protein
MNTEPKPRWFRCLLGEKARLALTRTQSDPETFTLLLAASGGPRWLGLVGADRALRKYLTQRRSAIPTLGASSGAWRLAAWASDQSGETYEDLIQEYIEQRFEGRPTPEEVSAVCRDYLARIFTPCRIRSALNHPKFQLNFTTALMPRAAPTKLNTMASLAVACFLNALDRRLLGWSYRRAVFSSLPHPTGSPLARSWDAIPSLSVPLSSQNFLAGILATGSIPTVLSGESNIAGSARGHHYDGGLVDYHFEVESHGPVLYPHFSADPVPGWLDRFPPYRKISREARSQLCIVMPSDEMLARYPTGSYPSRHHFKNFSNDERIRKWRTVVKENQLLEKELNLCLESADLARISEPL